MASAFEWGSKGRGFKSHLPDQNKEVFIGIVRSGGSNMSGEKRKAVRLKKQLFIQYGFETEDKSEKWDTGTLRDISKVGMCVVTNREFPDSKVLHFRLKFPSNPSMLLEFEGRVVATKVFLADTYSTRVEFLSLDEKQKEAVHSYLKIHLGEEKYKGVERRKNSRINSKFIVSYRVAAEDDNIDISQTKNLSIGGMVLTTNRQFPVGAKLALDIRLPSAHEPIKIIGEVADSRQVIEGVMYDTRLKFFVTAQDYLKVIKATIDYYLKKG